MTRASSLSLQGLLGSKEGALVRHVERGSPAGVPWKVLQQDGSKFVQIGQPKARPQAAELELIFINASAAASPVTQAVKFFKGLTGKK